MKTILFFFALMFSATSFAVEVCDYRFNPRLAVTVTINDRSANNLRGSISWDDVNVCAGDFCTEIFPGTFKVRYRDLTPPRTQGILIFNVKAISSRDDLGNRYNRNSLFGNFIQNAKFFSFYVPEPNLRFRWRGRTHVMRCRDSEKKELL